MTNQQAPSATVDEMIANKYLDKVVVFLKRVGILEEITEESTDDDKMYDGDIRYHIYSAIENAITEALRGSYTRDETIAFAQMCQMESDGTKWEGNTIGRMIDQFDSEENDG